MATWRVRNTMPKSKRDKVVPLTVTKKKSYETKKELVSEIQECCDKYAHVFLIEVHNERNNLIKEIRESWKHSRIFLGRNKVMALSLGRTVETEYKKDIHKLSKGLVNKRGLLFTNEKVDDVKEWFKSHKQFCFARNGSIATETVVLPEGPLDLPHPMEPQLRQLGLPTRLKDGVIVLDHEHTVCTAGKALTTQQAVILKHIGNCMAEFKMEIIAHWSDEVYTIISESGAAMEITGSDSDVENEEIEDVNEN